MTCYILVIGNIQMPHHVFLFQQEIISERYGLNLLCDIFFPNPVPLISNPILISVRHKTLNKNICIVLTQELFSNK